MPEEGAEGSDGAVAGTWLTATAAAGAVTITRVFTGWPEGVGVGEGSAAGSLPWDKTVPVPTTIVIATKRNMDVLNNLIERYAS